MVRLCDHTWYKSEENSGLLIAHLVRQRRAQPETKAIYVTNPKIKLRRWQQLLTSQPTGRRHFWMSKWGKDCLTWTGEDCGLFCPMVFSSSSSMAGNPTELFFSFRCSCAKKPCAVGWTTAVSCPISRMSKYSAKF